MGTYVSLSRPELCATTEGVGKFLLMGSEICRRMRDPIFIRLEVMIWRSFVTTIPIRMLLTLGVPASGYHG